MVDKCYWAKRNRINLLRAMYAGSKKTVRRNIRGLRRSGKDFMRMISNRKHIAPCWTAEEYAREEEFSRAMEAERNSRN